MSKPEARAYSAASNTTKAAGPLAWGDKCFLCSNQIGESEPRGFYTGKNGTSMMISHRGCLDALDAVGGNPRDLPWNKAATSATANAVNVNTPGVSNIRFDDVEHMQTFIAARGPIPDGVGIYVGDQKLR